jgi:hypothetical protein
MWSNNFKALVLNILVNIVEFLLLNLLSSIGVITGDGVLNQYGLLLFIPFVILYIMAGFILPSQNSVWKNLISVLLVTVFGFLLGLWHYFNPNPLIALIGLMDLYPIQFLGIPTPSHHTTWGLIGYFVLCSIVPSLFIWLGIQYKHSLIRIFRRN